MAQQKLVIKSNSKEFEVFIDPDSNEGKVKIGNDEYHTAMNKLSSDTYSFLFNGKSYLFNIQPDEEGCRIAWSGRETLLEIEDERKRLLKTYVGASAAGKGVVKVKAPMPGLVVKLLVEVGSEVQKGDSLIVVEAMKMENEVKAPQSGKVTDIKVSEKQPVERGEVMVVIEGS